MVNYVEQPSVTETSVITTRPSIRNTEIDCSSSSVDDDFDIDRMIDERKSERSKRSSSGSRSEISESSSPTATVTVFI